MKLFNSLNRRIEEFKPTNPPEVRMYSCGPTVYQRAHIGNFRTYTSIDLLNRVLKANGYKVRYIMNITDVGHLTGDNEGDSSTGDDRMEIAARKTSKSIWSIAEEYTNIFILDYKSLGLLLPDKFVKATDHIKEQIELISELERKGFTYKTKDGIYFDTSKYKDYGKLSTLDEIKSGSRLILKTEKKNERDFALWKLSQKFEKRQMEWDSPWGKGFPGWHIECSAMSLKYLGPTLDIHCGGEDLRSTHHPNEIAQSEVATGKIFSKFWIHISFVLINNQKMSKSLGNALTLDDVSDMGFDPFALKYLYYSAHYRKQLNITKKSLDGAKISFLKLKNIVRKEFSKKEKDVVHSLYKEFLEIISNDLDSPKAIAKLWSIAKDRSLSSRQKSATLIKCDGVMGLGLENVIQTTKNLPEKIKRLSDKRLRAKLDKNWSKADSIRKEIEEYGYKVTDTETDQIIEFAN